MMTTFSRDAVEEILDRIAHEVKVWKNQPQRLIIGTFHSLALKQLRDVGRLGKIQTQIETKHLIERAMHEQMTRKGHCPVKTVDEAESVIAQYKSRKQNPQPKGKLDLNAELAQIYISLQAESGAQDFTDLIIASNRLMASGEIAPFKATHILTDEFQDIDELQYQWLMHHINQTPVPIATAVGDDDQSIYGFRRSLGYFGMMRFVEDTDAQIITLNKNYRSTDAILNRASRLIGFNENRIAKDIQAMRGEGHEPRYTEPVAGQMVEDYLVEELRRICQDNLVTEPLPGQEAYSLSVKSGQVAILSRNNAGLNPIEGAFIKQRIPYLRSGRSIWDDNTLQVYVAVLQSLERQESMGFEIALKWAGLGEGEVRTMVENASGSLWNAIDPTQPPLSEDGHLPTVGALFQLGRGWALKLQGEPDDIRTKGPIYGVAGWMAGVLNTRFENIKADSEKAEASKKHAITRSINYLGMVRDALARVRGNLTGRILQVQQGRDSKIPRVILSTFHASKGLEWEHVFLVNCCSGQVPKLREGAQVEDLEEERRVFYVAMTRARDGLILVGRRDKPPSPFLEEAGVEHRKPSHVTTLNGGCQ